LNKGISRDLITIFLKLELSFVWMIMQMLMLEMHKLCVISCYYKSVITNKSHNFKPMNKMSRNGLVSYF
jgi:hypothetical protein